MTRGGIAGGARMVEWRNSESAVDYPEAVAEMERRIAAIRAGVAPELVWLLEHPPLYTAGTSARPEDLIDSQRLPVYRSGRGGRYTYHGPGQRIAYVVLDLARRGRDVGCHVHRLEEWMIRTLAHFGLEGLRRPGRVGVWIADPDLDHYRGIVPCGIAEHGVTSLAALGVGATRAQVDAALRATFDEVFETVPSCAAAEKP